MTDPFDGHTLADAAARWHAAGCSVLPIRLDGSKRPVGTWHDLQHKPMPAAQVASAWNGGEPYGIAIACGAGSGNLEMVEFEGRAVADGTLSAFLDAGRAAGLHDLLQRVAAGYVETSPKGGLHLFYRVTGAPVPGNTRLAQQPCVRPDGTPGREPLIETRGQGGYVIVAPTPAAGSSPDGPRLPWRAGGNGPEQIAVITADERDELVRLARTFDRMPVGPAPTGEQVVSDPSSSHATAGAGAPIVAAAGDRPGDVYAAATPWPAILGPHGWRVAFTRADRTYWTRPGKSYGISATTSDDGAGGLWVFTTSTTFEPEELYTKFGAYAHLNHGGDLAAAASALAGQQGTGDTWAPPLAPIPGWAGPGPSATGGAHTAPGPGIGATPGGQTDVTIQPTSVPPAPPAVSTWAPVDLAAILAGDYAPPAAELMPRTDGAHLLYRGKTHSFIGESESGKSLVAQAECARILRDTNERVAYIDYEDDPAPVVGRLVAMGAPPAAIAQRFDYIKPQASPYSAEESEQFRMLLGRQYALVVVDGVTGAILQMGDRPGGNPNDTITRWARRVLDPIAQWTGAAVVVIDHFNKDAEGRGRYATGGHAKMDVLTGAAYTVEPLHTLGVGLCGTVVLRVAKDRPSGVRPHCGPRRPVDRTQEAARVVIDSTRPGRTIVSVAPHETGDVRSGPEKPPRPTVLMGRVSEYLISVGAASRNQIESSVRGKATGIRDALTELVGGGYVLAEQINTRGGGIRYTSLRPYNAEEEAQVIAGAAKVVPEPRPNLVPMPEQGISTNVSADAPRSGTNLAFPQVSEGTNFRPQDREKGPQQATSSPTSSPTSSHTLSRENVKFVPTSSPTSSLVPETPPEPRPSPSPRSGGRGTGSDEDSGGVGDKQNDQEPAASNGRATTPGDSALPVFRAPAPPDAADAPMAQPRLRPGERACDDCGWPLAAQLVAAGRTTHPVDCTAAGP